MCQDINVVQYLEKSGALSGSNLLLAPLFTSYFTRTGFSAIF